MTVNDLIQYLMTLPDEIRQSEINLKDGFGIVKSAESIRIENIPCSRSGKDKNSKIGHKTVLEAR